MHLDPQKDPNLEMVSDQMSILNSDATDNIQGTMGLYKSSI